MASTLTPNLTLPLTLTLNPNPNPNLNPNPNRHPKPNPHPNEACLRRCYRGFVHEPKPLPGALQQRVQAALVRLNAEGYFHHDVVLGSTKGGTAPVPTIVRRILVGEPGITYKVSPNPNPNQLSPTLVRASPNPNPNPDPNR